MINLGNLVREQGRVEEAEDACRDVVVTGHPDLAPLAEVGVESLRSSSGDATRAERLAE